MGSGKGRGGGYGEGSGGACGCGFICSVLCMVVAWVTFLACITCLTIPLWESGSNYTAPNNVTYDHYYKGLFLCCSNFTSGNFDCFHCSEDAALEDLLSWEYACQALYAIATACMLVIAIGSILMVCDKCRGCITSTVYTVLCILAFVCTLCTVVVYAAKRGFSDELNYDFAFFMACITVPLCLVSSIVFCQAIFTTMDCCPCV